MTTLRRVVVGAYGATLALGAPHGFAREAEPEGVGVIYVFHGGSEKYSEETSWNATMQIFSYDPHSAVYQNVIWNSEIWPRMLGFGNAPKERGKYGFEYARIGRPDPAGAYTRMRYEHMRDALQAREAELRVEFIVDYASWLAPDPSQHIYPRSIYTPGVEGGVPLTYCGSKTDGGVGPDYRWPGCDPERYNTDGTIERLLARGVGEILMIDMTTSGVRFFKSWDVINLARQVVEAHNDRADTDVQVWWINDPTDLMTESYPDEPPGWTRSLGAPERDRAVPLEDRPNPVSSDPRLAVFHAEGIEAAFAPGIDPADIGVMLINHATRNHDQYYDPKIDDTVVLNRNIKHALLDRNPGMAAANIVGSWMGRKERNPNIKPRPPAFTELERTRRMRGENLGDAWLYETAEELPGGEWGYRYWDALEFLKNQRVKHIVVAFPQIMVDSVLNLVEVPNQIAKEIGYKSWLYFDQLDFDTYPGLGHPFADYWGVWVETECPLPGDGGTTGPCCFEMGGCADGRPYPPPRLTPIDELRDDLDPSLAFDVSAHGHLGYDAANGAPDPDRPVQNQFAGTWALWTPPNGNPAVGRFLADKVVEFFLDERPPRRVEPVYLGTRPLRVATPEAPGLGDNP
jgi:hypothetical protein